MVVEEVAIEKLLLIAWKNSVIMFSSIKNYKNLWAIDREACWEANNLDLCCCGLDSIDVSYIKKETRRLRGDEWEMKTYKWVGRLPLGPKHSLELARCNPHEPSTIIRLSTWHAFTRPHAIGLCGVAFFWADQFLCPTLRKIIGKNI